MAELIVLRVRRVIAASVEDAVDAMERAGGTKVMREAIREVERATEDVRDEHEAVATRRLQAQRQQRMIGERLATLQEKARFAVGQGREDLAEAAIASQIDLEAQAQRLNGVLDETQAELARLDECLAALAARRTQMEEELEALEAARREAAMAGGDGQPKTTRGTERKVERAEEAFDRAMAGAGGVGMAPLGRGGGARGGDRHDAADGADRRAHGRAARGGGRLTEGSRCSRGLRG